MTFLFGEFHTFFDFNDKDSFADFTFEDSEGIMAALLDVQTDQPKTFLLEVKTSKEIKNKFMFSSRQFKTVRYH